MIRENQIVAIHYSCMTYLEYDKKYGACNFYQYYVQNYKRSFKN